MHRPVYVQQQQPPPPRQYVQSGPNGGGVYMSAPPNQQYVTTSAPPQVMRTTTVQQQPAVVAPANTTTVIRRTNVVDHAEIAPSRIEVEGQLVASAILAGFLLFSFQPDKVVNNIKAAQVLSLQLVAFGCFLSAVSFYAMYQQRGRKHSMRIWVYCAQTLSVIGFVLLIAAVAMTTRIQLGEEYEYVWIASIIAMIVLMVIPILCDIGFCFSVMVGNCMGWVDSLW